MGYAATINCDPCGGAGVQGICPAGFHIPTDLEWSRFEYCVESTMAPTGSTTLVSFQTGGGLRGSSTLGVGPGSKMKATSGSSPAWDGNNISGFSALPGGDRYYNDGFFYNNDHAYYWSSTQSSISNSYYRDLITGGSQVLRGAASKSNGYSVRCIQN